MGITRYSNEELAEIAKQVDIVEYIEQTEELHRRGQNWFIKCPFHEGDDTPSLCVYPDSQSWHCFGCGKGGSIYNWIVDKEGLTFGEAIERVTKLAGIELTPRIETPTVQFLKSLQKQKESTMKPKSQTTERKELYWKPDYYDKYSDELPQEWIDEGMTPEALRKYEVRIDHSANRIVYPVVDSENRLIGVKGRTRIKDYKLLGLQKYMNYTKIGTIDYFAGWFEALKAAKAQKQIIIFEGIKSCIKACGWGILNTVSSESANLTDGQIQLLIKNGFGEVIIGWDNDQPLSKIAGDSKIQMLKRFAKVSIINDTANLLQGEKMAPVDKGEEVFRELLDRRIKI